VFAAKSQLICGKMCQEMTAGCTAINQQADTSKTGTNMTAGVSARNAGHHKHSGHYLKWYREIMQ
jgi:hypothetical protein